MALSPKFEDNLQIRAGPNWGLHQNVFWGDFVVEGINMPLKCMIEIELNYWCLFICLLLSCRHLHS